MRNRENHSVVTHPKARILSWRMWEVQVMGIKNNDKHYGKTVICKHKTPDGRVYIEYVKVECFDSFRPDEYRNNLSGTLFQREGISRFGWDNISHETLAQIDSTDWKKDLESAIREHRSYIPSVGYNDRIVHCYCNPIRCIDLNVVFPFYSDMARYIGCPGSSAFTQAFTYGDQMTLNYAGHVFEKATDILETDTFPYASIFERGEMKNTKIPETSHYVYKFVLNDEVIYIGKSDVQSFDRIFQHGHPSDNIDKEAWDDINNSDIYYAPLINKTMSDVVESELIRRYKPRLNKAKATDWCGIELSGINWLPVRVGWRSELKTLREENASYRAIIDSLSNKLKNCVPDDKSQKLLNENTKLKREVRSLHESIKLRNEIEEMATNERVIRRMVWKCRKCKEGDIYPYKHILHDAGITRKEIYERYKLYKPINHISISTDAFGRVECIKHFYSHTYFSGELGPLLFDGFHIRCKSLVGCYIYTKPCESADKWDAIQPWEYRGSPIFYPVEKDEIDILKMAEEIEKMYLLYKDKGEEC